MEHFGWGKFEYYKSMGKTTKMGEGGGANQIFKVQWGEAKEGERGNTILDLNLVGENLEGNYY